MTTGTHDSATRGNTTREYTTGSKRTPRDKLTGRGTLRRVLAMSRAETRLLLRNKTAIVTVLGMPIFFVLMLFISLGDTVEEVIGLGTFVATMMISFVLLFVVYYNLVTAYVARREELVLKRLRTSEAADAEILCGTAVPSLLIAVVQTVIVLGFVAFLPDVGMPVNPILLVVAFVGGAAVFTLLAAASTVFTRTPELAQVTTLPVLLVSFLMAGVFIPLDAFPDTLAVVARILPLTPVVQLTQLGTEGALPGGDPVDLAGTFGEALVPALVLALWVYLGVYATRRWFRWEPRA